MDKTIGIIGLGIMGGAFSTNILEAGYAVVGRDIDRDLAEAFTDKGGTHAASPRAVAEQADIIITSLPSAAAFHEVVSGDDGIASSGRDGVIVVECSTLAIDDKIKARDALGAAGITLLDCPVSGTGSMAATKDLVIYASGDEAAFETCRFIFDAFAKGVFHVGEFGNGSKMKFIANLLVQIHNVATAEAMVLGLKAGLDPGLVYEVISAGAGTSKVFEVRAPMMVKNDYSAATMKIDVWKKDMKVIGEFATGLECPTPLFSACSQMYLTALAQGRGAEDTAAICAVYEEMANHKRP